MRYLRKITVAYFPSLPISKKNNSNIFENSNFKKDQINQLFLHLLPNEAFKRALSTAFINNYNFTSYSLTLSSESEKLSNRIVHISVQLLANQETVLELVRENDIFGVFMRSFKLLFHETLTDGIVSDNMVIDISAGVVKNTGWLKIVRITFGNISRDRNHSNRIEL